MSSLGILFGTLYGALFGRGELIAYELIISLLFIITHRINRHLPLESPCTKALLATYAICAAELIFGIIFNRIMGLRLWDCSDRFLHILGQICPSQFPIRFVISLIALSMSGLSVKSENNLNDI